MDTETRLVDATVALMEEAEAAARSVNSAAMTSVNSAVMIKAANAIMGRYGQDARQMFVSVRNGDSLPKWTHVNVEPLIHTDLVRKTGDGFALTDRGELIARWFQP